MPCICNNFGWHRDILYAFNVEITPASSLTDANVRVIVIVSLQTTLWTAAKKNATSGLLMSQDCKLHHPVVVDHTLKILVTYSIFCSCIRMHEPSTCHEIVLRC